MTSDIVESRKIMRAIWCAVGLVLFTMGLVIFITGLYLWLFKIPEETVLANLHPDIWWGGFMVIMGMTFFLISYTKKIDNK